MRVTPIGVTCPKCSATPGLSCRSAHRRANPDGGYALATFHAERVVEARLAARAVADVVDAPTTHGEP